MIGDVVDRPQRADAARNRDTIVRAYLDLLRERGGDVPMYEVAKRAGVGQGTLYRHFPERSELAAQVFTRMLDEVAAMADSRADDDPSLFVEMLTRAVENQTHMHGLISALIADAEVRPAVAHLTRRTLRVFDAPVRAAKSGGVLREDFRTRDVLLVLSMVDGALAIVDTPRRRTLVARRVLELALAGALRR